MKHADIFAKLGLNGADLKGGDLIVRSPIDGAEFASVKQDTPQSVEAKIARAQDAFLKWRAVPAPRRGELVRLFGEELRANKEALGALVTLECGKIIQEGYGEVQEMIDICDFAVGLSRQLYGLTIASERPGHRMAEYWHPLGLVGVISAFNFPVAVWAWNATLALVCGDSVIWKPSEKTPVTALACMKLLEKALHRFGDAPEGLTELIIGGRDVGEVLVADSRMSLISATGSTAMGRAIGPRIAERFGRSILELGGNNAIIITPSADLEMVLRATLFGAVATCGQRCTTARRLIIHESLHDQILTRLKKAYGAVNIGNPLDPDTLVGPLVDADDFKAMAKAIAQARADGGEIFGGERALEGQFPNAYYVHPALAEMPRQTDGMRHETFAPLLYTLKYRDFDEAMALHNDVPQGLSSAIFTTDMREAERFTSALGSDCGIANVNLGTNGAEIGGAFGGEKETGGGRESGSDSWKGYMRRMTSTVNYSRELPLAQGIKFDLA